MDERDLLRHFLAALVYRVRKALNGAPAGFGSFSAGAKTRTPAQLVCHITNVLGYAQTFFVGGAYRAEPLPSLEDEIKRFHSVVQSLSDELRANTKLQGTTIAGLLQGPFSDAMTHAGQLAMLRRLAGDPVAPENFVFADIAAERLGPEQADAVSPDEVWPEAPEGWRPPSQRQRKQ